MLIETLLQPLSFDFMRRAFLIALYIALPTALLSCFLVLKGWALMGDAVSHATLPGIVLAWFIGAPLAVGAFAAGFTCSVSIGYLARNSRIKYDSLMGIVFSTLFAIGVILLTLAQTNQHLSHVLFGNMLGIGAQDLWTSGSIALLVTAIMACKWRDFLLLAFDPIQAQASGLNTRLLDYVLLACLSLTIVSTLTSVGLILAVALLITPGAIAFLLTRHFGAMLVVAAAACLLSLTLGAYISFFLDSAPAPTAVLLLTLAFLIALIYRQQATKRLTKAANTSSRLG